LISAGSLVRAQSGPPDPSYMRFGFSVPRILSKTYHFDVWRESKSSDQTPFPPHAEKCSLTSAYWVESTTLENRSGGWPSLLTDIKIIKLLRAYDGCLGANRL
jgi:hypothetical protein